MTKPTGRYAMVIKVRTLMLLPCLIVIRLSSKAVRLSRTLVTVEICIGLAFHRAIA